MIFPACGCPAPELVEPAATKQKRVSRSVRISNKPSLPDDYGLVYGPIYWAATRPDAPYGINKLSGKPLQNPRQDPNNKNVARDRWQAHKKAKREEYNKNPKPPAAEPDVYNKVLELCATPESKSAFTSWVDTQIAKASLADFCKQAWHVVEPSTVLEWNWHHEFICNVLQGMFFDWLETRKNPQYTPKVRNAVFGVPPGSLKSKLMSVFFPVWAWIHCPGWKVICLSVNEQAALRDARASRALIKDPWFQNSFKPDWKLKDDQDALSNYGNTASGERLSKASGSEIVGLRADLILYDDPNNPLDAESALERNKVNDLWDTNIYSRVNDDRHSLRIGIQQRVHANDWTAHVIAAQGIWSPENPTGWLNVVLPAEFEVSRKCVTPWGSDPRTKEGESIHPSRLTESALANYRKVLRDKYAGQYQQRPTLAEGGKVKRSWWNFCRLTDDGSGQFEYNNRPRPAGTDEKVEPYFIKRAYMREGWDLDWLVVSVDPANKKTEDGSNWGILVIGGKDGRRFVLDDRTQRGDYIEILEVLNRTIAKWRPDRLLIEDKAAGPTLMTALKKQLEEGQLLDDEGKPLMVTIEAVSADAKGDKTDRLMVVASFIENGQTYLMDGAAWLVDFVEELAEFPLGRLSDRVDALSQCLAHSMAEETLLPDW